MSVWLAIPTCNPARASRCFAAWRDMGYQTAAFLDRGQSSVSIGSICYSLARPYPGYWRASNLLADALLLHRDRSFNAPDDTEIIIFGGDDIYPDPTRKAWDIAKEFKDRFPDGFGVMQPTGDDIGKDAAGVPASARICGSPWIGRGWIERAYGGMGPTWPFYHSFYGDEELQHVAQREGVLWQRPDLCQRHEHWSRPGAEKRLEYQTRNSDLYWKRDKALFDARRAAGFPGSEPLPK